MRGARFTHIIYLGSEGKTEVRYLQDLTLKREVKIKRLVEEAGPVKLCENFIKEASKFSHEPNASYWILFDHDSRQDLLRKAYDIIDKHNQSKRKNFYINISLSTPCIEIWPLAHLKTKDFPKNTKAAQSLLKKEMPGYDHAHNPYFNIKQLKGNEEQAIKIADQWKKLLGDTKEYEAPLYAGIYELVIFILKYREKE